MSRETTHFSDLLAQYLHQLIYFGTHPNVSAQLRILGNLIAKVCELHLHGEDLIGRHSAVFNGGISARS